MRTKPLITGAVVIAIRLLITIVFIPTHSSGPSITVRHVTSVRSGSGFEITYEVTNHSTSSYLVYPVSVIETRNGLVWQKCFDFSFDSHARQIFGPHESEIITFEMPNLTTGSPLRLRMCAVKRLAGLERFLMGLNLRFRQGSKNVSLNPFDKSSTIFSSKLTQIMSDEFVEP